MAIVLSAMLQYGSQVIAKVSQNTGIDKKDQESKLVIEDLNGITLCMTWRSQRPKCLQSAYWALCADVCFPSERDSHGLTCLLRSVRFALVEKRKPTDR